MAAISTADLVITQTVQLLDQYRAVQIQPRNQTASSAQYVLKSFTRAA